MREVLQVAMSRLSLLRDTLKTARRTKDEWEDLSLLLTANLLDREIKFIAAALEAEDATQTADSDAGL